MTSLENLDPRFTLPHLSTRVINSFIVYFSETITPDFARDAVVEAGLPLEYLKDPEQWVSLEFAHRFTTAVSRRLYDFDGIPPKDHPMWQQWRAAARISFRRDVIGAIYHMFRAFGSPGFFFSKFPMLMSRGNRATSAEYIRSGHGSCVLRFWATDPTLADSVPACWSRFGVLESAPLIWGLPMAGVTHPLCMHDPDAPSEYCEYHIAYSERRIMRWLPAALLIGGTSGSGALLSQIVGSTGPFSQAWMWGALVGFGLEGWRRSRKADRARSEDVERLNVLLEEADRHYRDLWEERQALRRTLLINRKISGYLAIDLVDRIVKNPELENSLGGVRTEAAGLFADIVGFTPRCESRSPEDIVAELNLYFGEIDRVIARFGGIIDKRLGDGVMVVFTAQADVSHFNGLHRRAILCGLELLRILPECNKKLVARGAPPIQIRIGLAAGDLVLGNIGSEMKLEYTVIGDVVNLAARLEGQANPGCLLMPKAMLAAVEAAEVSDERTIKVKGKQMPVDVVELSPSNHERGFDPVPEPRRV